MGIENLANYGVLGLFSILMIYIISYGAKYFISLHRSNSARITTLEEEMKRYLIEDRSILIKTVDNSTASIEKHNELIEELLKAIKTK